MMLRLAELLQLPTTTSAYASSMTFFELSQRQDWRCYSSTFEANTETLIARFLNSHARLPGILDHEVPAHEPAQVLRWGDTTNYVQGFTFSNGAVFVETKADGTQNFTLLIADDAAQRWNYPDTHVYLYLIDEEG